MQIDTKESYTSPNIMDNFDITLTREKLLQCGKYKRFIIYAAIIRQQGNEVQWSNTFAMQVELDQNV